jgi:hypothetical protein
VYWNRALNNRRRKSVAVVCAIAAVIALRIVARPFANVVGLVGVIFKSCVNAAVFARNN